MREVPDSAIDPAANERTPGVVAQARPISFLLPGQDLLLHPYDFLHAGGEAERLAAPGLILRQHLRSIRNGWRRRRLLLRTGCLGLARVDGEAENNEGREQGADHSPMMTNPRRPCNGQASDALRRCSTTALAQASFPKGKGGRCNTLPQSPIDLGAQPEGYHPGRGRCQTVPDPLERQVDVPSHGSASIDEGWKE